MNKSKIMVQAVTPIIARFNEKIKAVGLRRDLYLNGVLRVEVNNLKTELEGKVNSEKAKSFLVSKLRELPTTPTSIMLDVDVIDAIEHACTSHNIARDCFINRILFFLAAERNHLERIHIDTSKIRLDPYQFPVNSLDGASELLGNPFSEIREYMKTDEFNIDVTFFTWPFGGKIEGLNCYFPDYNVPGTEEYLDLESLI